MRDLLFLAHRLPFPPNKGDKVRSYHLLKHLAADHRVFLGTFVDDPQDEGYIDAVRELCAGLHVVRLQPRFARLRSLAGLASGEAMTLPYYRDAGMRAWVERTVREQRIDTAVVFSSAMAQYATAIDGLRLLVDFVDVDSAKWAQYSRKHSWPLSWLLRREAKRLLAFECAVAERASASFFVTEAEVDLFRRLAPNCRAHIEVVCNGVDSEYFSPEAASSGPSSPYPDGDLPLVFTGAMDYWPNIDAVVWFVSEVLPAVRLHHPAARFYIVGMNPAPSVRALAGEHVVVTGTVPDVRPYLQHAAVVVAPLRVARGVQNKVLEAMAMARPVVVAQTCATGIDAVVGRDFDVASDAATFADRVDALLREPGRALAMGRAARERALGGYCWEAHLKRLDPYLDTSIHTTVPLARHGHDS
ncbi:MAG TPA: TIGR03087 family PEP-CTERM/XrtA system glycosyltransferase [Rhodocyclaceae bacterium]|nr:TIGR03087 family PEP-CTERM/XrtA system glycosyltransferase [Rhodocyclaceae bacterium]HUY02633.1 TIGR03087 family PEP-CTERM/XrtA system glycosyltransferase [Rhodocyclaceae bacterium]